MHAAACRGFQVLWGLGFLGLLLVTMIDTKEKAVCYSCVAVLPLVCLLVSFLGGDPSNADFVMSVHECIQPKAVTRSALSSVA